MTEDMSGSSFNRKFVSGIHLSVSVDWTKVVWNIFSLIVALTHIIMTFYSLLPKLKIPVPINIPTLLTLPSLKFLVVLIIFIRKNKIKF